MKEKKKLRKMKTIKETIAYHEAGHVMAYILVGKKFRYATIKENDSAMGHVRQRANRISFDVYINSMIMAPRDFNKLFLHDFIYIAGFIAEAIYTGKFNGKRALADFISICDMTTQDLPEQFVKQYMKFLYGYAMLVLQVKVNWLRIEAIAEALMEQETLTYIEVINVSQKAILKQINN